MTYARSDCVRGLTWCQRAYGSHELAPRRLTPSHPIPPPHIRHPRITLPIAPLLISPHLLSAFVLSIYISPLLPTMPITNLLSLCPPSFSLVCRYRYGCSGPRPTNTLAKVIYVQIPASLYHRHQQCEFNIIRGRATTAQKLRHANHT